MQQSTTMENLPNDILLNIFIRLLAKQLSQMRCVSKSWNAILSQSSFVKSHLDHHTMYNNDRVFMVFYNDSDDHESFSAHSCRSPHLELTNFIELPPNDLNLKYNTSMIKIIGSVHGLICSHYGNHVIHIWNPSLSAVSTLPPHYIPSRGSYATYLRFGFDPKTQDYKVVKLIGLTDASTENVVRDWLKVEVYSMRTHNWEFINQRFPSYVTNIFDDDYACVDGHDGHLHWCCNIDEEGVLGMIVAFDLGSETFREIPYPDSLLDGQRMNHLCALGGKLCLMLWYEGREDECEVWVMDEYGMAESWVKHLVFSNDYDDIVYGITLHNEVLIIDDDCHLVLYDPTAHKALQKFYIGNSSAQKIVEYVDSLVWIAPPERHLENGARQN